MTPEPYLAEILWQYCATKRCCCVRTVFPTGTDIWRIATTLKVAPEHFLRPVPAPSSDGFILDPDQPLIYPALAQRTVSSRSTACVFLVQFGDQASRCGITTMRPLPCQSFPAVTIAGLVEVDPSSGCTCRSWSLAEVDRDRASGLLQQEAEEREQYHDVMRAWNDSVALTKRRYTFSNLCQYVLEVYEARQPTRIADQNRTT